MWPRDGHLVTLKDVLVRVDIDNLHWRIHNLWFLPIAESGLDVAALEHAASSPVGLRMSSPDLKALAAKIHQVVDGDFLGFEPGLGEEPESAAALILRAIDSDEWVIEIRDPG